MIASLQTGSPNMTPPLTGPRSRKTTHREWQGVDALAGEDALTKALRNLPRSAWAATPVTGLVYITCQRPAIHALSRADAEPSPRAGPPPTMPDGDILTV